MSMRVQILESMVGDSFSYIPGDIAEVDNAEGARLVEAGRAISLETKQVENPEASARPAKREKR
jgi:hypothetical protein